MGQHNVGTQNELTYFYPNLLLGLFFVHTFGLPKAFTIPFLETNTQQSKGNAQHFLD